MLSRGQCNQTIKQKMLVIMIRLQFWQEIVMRLITTVLRVIINN